MAKGIFWGGWGKFFHTALKGTVNKVVWGLYIRHTWNVGYTKAISGYKLGSLEGGCPNQNFIKLLR